MNLLYDLMATQPSGYSKRHGGGKYGEAVFFRMVERSIPLMCFYDSNNWINPVVKKIIDEKKILLFDINEIDVETIIQKYRIDRLYSCLPGNLSSIKSCEVYGTVHGLREFETAFDSVFWEYRHSFRSVCGFILRKSFSKLYYKYCHRKNVKRFIESDFHLITVSEHSKYAWMVYFPEIESKEFKVYYSPYTGGKKERRNICEEQLYFLLVSGNVWTKNVVRAVKAFDQLVSRGYLGNLRMKITGAERRNFKYKIKNQESFDFLGYVRDEELEKLYANAYVFIYPSLNEGFGAPPIAAMRYGVPVIASPFSAISEICGSGALYFNPCQVEEIMNRMLMIMDCNWYEEYSKKAREQYKRIRQRQDRDLDLMIDYIVG